MKLFDDRQLERLLRKIKRAEDLHREQDYAGAMAAYRKVHDKVRELGMSSGFVLWCMAVVADNAGELETAFDNVVEAITQDPLSAMFRNSFDIIVGRIRDAMSDPDLSIEDPVIARFHDRLTRTGQAGMTEHVTMVRHLLATQDYAAAASIAQAMTVLYPMAREAWLCRAAAVRATGDEDLALSCTAQAAVLEGDPVPFAVPEAAKG